LDVPVGGGQLLAILLAWRLAQQHHLHLADPALNPLKPDQRGLEALVALGAAFARRDVEQSQLSLADVNLDSFQVAEDGLNSGRAV
jgi:hypothetical protein